MIKSSRILSIILLLVVASASWASPKGDNPFEGKGWSTSIGGIYYYINEDNEAIVTNQKMSSVGSQMDGNSYSGAVNIPESIEVGLNKYPVVGIQDFAFYGCDGLISVQIPKTVKSIGEMVFSNSPALIQIIVDSKNENYSSDNGVLFDDDKETLIRFPEGKEGSYKAPSSVTTIAYEAFSYCTNLTNVTLSDGLVSIGSKAFYECANLTSVNIPETVTSIGDNAFYKCQALSSNINIPSGVMSINANTFQECSSLTTVTLNNGLTNIGTYAFEQCVSLKNINFPESLTSIEAYAFSKTGLTSVELPSKITKIKAGTFSECKLTSITLPDNLEQILVKAFYNNGTTITKINIPASVTSIANNAFAGTTIKNIYVNNIPSKTQIGETTPFHKATGMEIHVFTLLDTDFKNATNWSEYADYIVADIPIKHVTAVSLDETTLKIGPTASYQLNVSILPADATVKDVVFTSSSPNTVAIANATTGEIKACGIEGEAIITCTAADGSRKFATCKVTVKNGFVHAEEIVLNKTNVNMNIGDKFQLEATIKPTNASDKTAIWKSSNEAIATVDKESGLVTAIKSGNVTITARSSDGYVKATCEILVSYATYDIDEIKGAYTNVEQAHANTLIYKRTFNNTDWQPLYVPFRMSYDDWSDQFEVARLLNMHTIDTNDDGIADQWAMEFIRVKEGTLKENHPYLIKAKTKGYKEITINNATIYPAEINSIQCASTEYEYEFKGTYENITFPTGTNDNYLVMYEGAFYKGTKTKPYRIYLRISDKEGQLVTINEAKVIILDEAGFEETTSINSLESDKNNITAVYSANGIKQTSTKQGLNIIKMADGTSKKIFVK